QSRELHFALRVGAGFEIEFAQSSEPVREVDLHGNPVHRLAVGTVHGEIHRAWAGASVNDCDFTIARGLAVQLGAGEQTQNRQKQTRKNGGFHDPDYRMKELRLSL